MDDQIFSLAAKEYPSRYLSYDVTGVQAQLTVTPTNIAYFRLVPGINGVANTVSLKSVFEDGRNKNNMYFRH